MINDNNKFAYYLLKWIHNYPLALLAIITLLVYLPSLAFGFTELDDAIFVFKDPEYNKHLGNLCTSFARGVFDPVNDSYYRPLLLDSFIINYLITGNSAWGFHLLNIFFHVLAVILLYRLLLHIGLTQLFTFVAVLIFAVHPVLSQAVSWIPGRNDTLLAVFIFPFLHHTINYIEHQKWSALLWSSLFLLLAYFTKETAVFAAPAALVILVGVYRIKVFSPQMLILATTWVASFFIWYAARANATMVHGNLFIDNLAENFVYRIPLIVQYLGKIVFPVNLSVFPTQEDTVYYWGITALLLLALALLLTKKNDKRLMIAGGLVFVIFLIPALLIPKAINDQTFDQWLYLPMMGLILILSSINSLKSISLKVGLPTVIAVVLLLLGTNIKHQQSFDNPLAFWTQAAQSTPNSSATNMLLAQRITDQQKAFGLYRKAYRINPNEKFLNFFYAQMLQKQDSVLASEKYLLAEKEITGYPGADFLLSRVALAKHDTIGAQNRILSFLQQQPDDTDGNAELLHLYIIQNKMNEAHQLIQQMKKMGLPVPDSLKS